MAEAVRRLLVIAVLLQCADFMSALPEIMDKALIYFGRSDQILKQFFLVMSQHRYAEMDDLFKKGSEHLNKVSTLLDELSGLHIAKGTKAFRLKENLIVQMQILKEKMSSAFSTKAASDDEEDPAEQAEESYIL